MERQNKLIGKTTRNRRHCRAYPGGNRGPGQKDNTIVQRVLGTAYLVLAAIMIGSALEPEKSAPDVPSPVAKVSVSRPRHIPVASAVSPHRSTATRQKRASGPRIARKSSRKPSYVAVARRPKSRRAWDRNLHSQPPKGEFVRFFRMRATAYTPINTRMEGGRYTKTERDGRSAHGVAVDRDLIPLGTRLWVPGYGHAIADDIGGRIQGHRVDVRMQDRDRMDEWGVRRVRVYVLQEPRRGRTGR